VAELAFLDAVTAYLAAQPLAPAVAAARIGASAPFAAGDLPSVVLSLASSERRSVGLGDRGEVMHGALPVSVSIDLATPVLPADPSFTLLDPTRRILILPHGGQVRVDGTPGALGNADITVRQGANSFVVVQGAPQGGQVNADETTGTLTFGAPLPASGTVQAQYFLGEWERRVERIAGVLHVDACTASAADAVTLGASLVRQLLSPAARDAIRLLLHLSVRTVGAAEHVPAPANVTAAATAHFRRPATFAFEFQHLIDQPESSGGVIRRIPITTRLETHLVDRVTGAITSGLATVT
jgi:hypothetical protein